MSSIVPGLVAAAGGKIPGKVRMQKTIYLLDKLGLESGFVFEYRYYGPYSEALTEQVEDDVIFARLRATPARRHSDGVPYVVYESNNGEAVPRWDERLRAAIAEMQRVSATVLELAATMHWLAVVEARADWRDELRIRKGAKTRDGRERQALDLLLALRLPPAAGSPVGDTAIHVSALL